jgi:hypothetical protein
LTDSPRRRVAEVAASLPPPRRRHLDVEVRRLRARRALAEFVVLGGPDLPVFLQQPVGVGAGGAGWLNRLFPRSRGGGVPRYIGALAGGTSGMA